MDRAADALLDEPSPAAVASSLTAFRELLFPSLRESGAEMERLVEIAGECARFAASPGLGLDALARLIARSDIRPRRTCRIEFDGLTCWSARYVASEIMVEREISALGKTRGRIAIGFPDLVELPEASLEHAWASIALELVAQALTLKATLSERDSTDDTSRRARDTVLRAERLLNIGFWEFDPETSAFTWHPEARRLLGIEDLNALRRRRRNPILASLQDKIRSAGGAEAFVQSFCIVSDDGTENYFEAIGEVHPVGDGSSFGFVRRVQGPGESFFASPDEDILTELPSRRGLGIRLSETLLRAGTSGGLVTIDVNRFGEVNTIRGSDFGDAFLRAFARRLREMARSDFIARIGSNEFAVLFEDVPEEQAANRACAFVGGMRPLKVFGQDVAVALSVGVATFPGEGRTPTELMTNASLALGAAKAKGPNSYVRYTADLRAETVRKASLRSEVEIGLAAGHFVPFYQPKIDLRTGKIAGFEILGRWNAAGGMRGPGTFMEALEDPQIAREYFSRQLDRVLTDVSVWRQQGLEVGRMALNTSASDYTNYDLASHVLRRLEQSGLPPSVLGLEITETVILGQREEIRKTLSRLRAAGVEIALDDFGTGHASLTHLRELPVDVVKIDRSFVDRIAEDRGDRAIVSAVIDIGRAHRMKIVAEGTERQEQVAILQESACDQAQGYLYGRPMPAGDVPSFIRGWRGI